MAVNFFDPAAQGPQIDPQQLMALQLMKQGAQSPQGQTVGRQYVAPQASQYAAQLASALAGGAKMDQVQDGRRAQDMLNGGTGDDYQGAMSKLGKVFSGWGA